MTTVIKTKNSTTTTSAPSSLAQGELAVNITDKKLWVGNAATTPIQLLGAGADLSLSTATLSGNLTLSGGTANGVLYLNGSKVATSGSALVFDGTNLGVGQSSPSYKLDVSSTAVDAAKITTSFAGDANLLIMQGVNGVKQRFLPSNGTGNYNWQLGANATVSNAFEITPSTASGGTTFTTPALLVTSAGNVGIGTSSPTSYSSKFIEVSNATSAGLKLTAGTSGLSLGADMSYIASDKSLRIGTYESTAYVQFRTQDTERARIDSSGNLLLNMTDTNPAGNNVTGQAFRKDGLSSVSRDDNPCFFFNRSVSNGNLLQFYRQGTLVGSVSVTTTATAYNTSSDYRLKENIQPMVGALDKVSQLKPVTYDWKSGGSSQGFIAHELQAVVPDCVTGEKDAIDEEGKPVYQGIDTSFLVATLTAAIQEQQAIITDLKARIETLEAK